MHRGEPPVRMIARRGSLRSRGLAALVRAMWPRPLRQDDDIPAMRRRFEALDARHVTVGKDVRREPVDCDGVPAEWISVPETRPGRSLLPASSLRS